MNLYDINESLLSVIDNMEECEDKALFQQAINDLEILQAEKIDNTVKYIRNLEAEENAISEEVKRLQDKKKIISNKKERIKAYLYDFTSLTEGQKVKGGIFTLSLRNNAPNVKINDIEHIPNEYIKIEKVVDKNLLKTALKNGEIIEGATLETSTSLMIK